MTVALMLAVAYLLLSLWMNLGAVRYGQKVGYSPTRQFIRTSNGRRLFATVMLVALMPAAAAMFYAVVIAHDIIGGKKP